MRWGGAGPVLGPCTYWPAVCECGHGRPAAGLCRGRWGCQDTGHYRGAGEGQGRGPGQMAVCNSVSGIDAPGLGAAWPRGLCVGS